MDVRCSRCGTEYDFDDALVSERGTTVKCTNCGHQFKVYPGGGGGAPERWIVRKNSGRELVYTSLRELQRAIAQRQVGPADLLSRGGGHPLRALGAIAELEPFFHAQGLSAPGGPSEMAQRTLLGLSPGANPSGEDTMPDNPPFGEPAVTDEALPRVSARRTVTPPGGIRRSAPPPPRPPGNAYARFDEPEPKTVPRNPEPLIATEPPRAALGTTMSSHGSTSGSGRTPGPPENVSPAFRAYQDSFSDESLPSIAPARSSALRWIVGLVILGGLAFVGGTVGLKYMKAMKPATAPSAAQSDDRVQKLLDEGGTDLSRGDFESAKEKFDKASALAENDLRVLSALARLEATRADVPWLSLKLLDPAQKSEVDAERAELDQRLTRVRKAADAAGGVAPNDAAVIRARIDALRLAGDVAGARALVGSLGADTSQPDTAYVLAALDLTETSPTWPTILDRLRAATSAERGFGRAHAALVYALAASGALDDAKAELANVSSINSPLLGRLRTFVDHAPGASPSASAAAGMASAMPSAAPVAAGAAPPSITAVDDSAPHGMDFRKLLQDASAAKSGGDLTRADALYHAAQEQQPGNIEALSGLGDVARMRGDSSGAAGYYDQVLSQNPTYLPALVASADMKWASGNRLGALMLYKRVVNQADPGTPYGQHAAARIAEAQGGGGGGTPPPAEHAAPKPTTDTPAPTHAPTSDTPGIDTSDLPGFK